MTKQSERKVTQRAEKLKKLKSTADSWYEEWKLRLYEFSKAREGIRRARERYQLALSEYRKAKRK
jgi:hypothetical protein